MKSFSLLWVFKFQCLQVFADAFVVCMFDCIGLVVRMLWLVSIICFASSTLCLSLSFAWLITANKIYWPTWWTWYSCQLSKNINTLKTFSSILPIWFSNFSQLPCSFYSQNLRAVLGVMNQVNSGLIMKTMYQDRLMITKVCEKFLLKTEVSASAKISANIFVNKPKKRTKIYADERV